MVLATNLVKNIYIFINKRLKFCVNYYKPKVIQKKAPRRCLNRFRMGLVYNDRGLLYSDLLFFSRVYKSGKVVFYTRLFFRLLAFLPFLVFGTCLVGGTGKAFLARLRLVFAALIFYHRGIIHHQLYLSRCVAIQIVITLDAYQSKEDFPGEEEPLELLAVGELRAVLCSRRIRSASLIVIVISVPLASVKDMVTKKN